MYGKEILFKYELKKVAVMIHNNFFNVEFHFDVSLF